MISITLHGILSCIAIIYLLIGFVFAFKGICHLLKSFSVVGIKAKISDENTFTGGMYLVITLAYFVFAAIFSLA